MTDEHTRLRNRRGAPATTDREEPSIITVRPRLIEDLYRRFRAEWDVLHDRRDASRYKPYFLGPYVYFQDGDITYLVDGQQRVSTLHLLLILIRNLLVDQDARDEARQLETLICGVMYGERRYTIDIAERAALLDALMNGRTYEVRSDDPLSVRNLRDRYGDLEEYFPPELAGEALPYFHDWLLHRVCLVGIEAHDQGHGWEIFETMNDRGLQLSPVDLLKSLLLARSDQTQHRRLNDTWRKAMTGLSALDEAGAATEFREGPARRPVRRPRRHQRSRQDRNLFPRVDSRQPHPDGPGPPL